ncbi:TPA: hypothetical protein ACQRQG_002135, partial [Neisseria gonorrhoeae]
TARSIHCFAVPLPRFEAPCFIALCYPRLGRYSFGRFVTYKTIIALSFKPSFLTVKVKAV